VTERSLANRVGRSLANLKYEPWSFGDSIGFEGMLALGRDGRPELEGFVHGFARGWAATHRGFRPMDCTVPGAALCEVASVTDDATLRDVLLALAQYLVERPRLDGVFRTWDVSPLREPHGPDELSTDERELLAEPGPGVFVDCLHFDPPFFAALSRLVGDEEWLRLAAEQALGYVRLLQDPARGLFHHFVLERTGQAHILGWGRGQGWALLGLLDVIIALPARDPSRAELAGAAKRLIVAMLAAQRADGHWDAVVGIPAERPEPSTAAFMAVAFVRATKAGVITPGRVAEAVERARQAVLADVSEEGILHGVSVAVWASTSLSHYQYTPRGAAVPWGQGPLALMLAEGNVAE
jgi:unsaturated rhamnogalacturonyl hydrolase